MFAFDLQNRFCAENTNAFSERQEVQSPRVAISLERLQSTGERQAENSLLAPSLCAGRRSVHIFSQNRICFAAENSKLVQDERKHRATDLLLPWRASRALGKGRQRIPC